MDPNMDVFVKTGNAIFTINHCTLPSCKQLGNDLISAIKSVKSIEELNLEFKKVIDHGWKVCTEKPVRTDGILATCHCYYSYKTIDHFVECEQIKEEDLPVYNCATCLLCRLELERKNKSTD